MRCAKLWMWEICNKTWRTNGWITLQKNFWLNTYKTTKDSLEVLAKMENISVNATRDFDDYLPTDEELNELKQIIRETKDLTRGELSFAQDSRLKFLNLAWHLLFVVEKCLIDLNGRIIYSMFPSLRTFSINLRCYERAFCPFNSVRIHRREHCSARFRVRHEWYRTALRRGVRCGGSGQF